MTEDCVLDCTDIVAEVDASTLASLTRQCRRNLIREAEKRPNGWLHKTLAAVRWERHREEGKI